MLALQLSIQLILYTLTGFFVERLKIVEENFDKSLTSFLINIALPCMIISSFNTAHSPNDLYNCGILVVISVGYLLLMFGIGQLIFKVSGGDFTGRILRFGTMFTNFSFVGIPVVQALYGQTGLLYFVVFVVPIRMVYYSSAQSLLAPPEAMQERRSFLQHLKGWMSPPVVAVFIGLALYISNFSLPEELDKTISGIGSVCAPMGMILCGISLGKNNIEALFKLRYLLMPLLQNIILPAITVAIMYIIPVDPLVSKIVVIYAALPVASFLVAFIIQYDPRPEARLESAGSVFYSILICSITIPIWAAIAEYLFT